MPAAPLPLQKKRKKSNHYTPEFKISINLSQFWFYFSNKPTISLKFFYGWDPHFNFRYLYASMRLLTTGKHTKLWFQCVRCWAPGNPKFIKPEIKEEIMTKYYPKNFKQQMRRSSLYKQKTKDKNWFNNIKCLIIIIIISKQNKDYKATFKESKA